MTASKSSRARNARIGAQASAARSATKGGSTGGSGSSGSSGTAVKNGTAARNGTATKNSTATRNRGAGGNTSAKGNSTAKQDSTATRNGGAGGNAGAKGNSTATTDRGGRDQARTAPGRNGATERGARTQQIPAEVAPPGPAVWLQIATFVLALAGLGVSIYLTIAHFTESALLGCSESGLVNCAKVTTSPQSYIFGIPVAVLGLAFYLFAAAIMSPWAWQSARREIHLLRIASLVAAMGLVLYLIYAELFIIGSICLYCTSVHAITFALFVLTMTAAAAWGLSPGARWRPERAAA